MDMTAEAITAIKDLGTTADEHRVIEHSGKMFLVNGSNVEEFIPQDQVESISVVSLSAMIEYIQNQDDTSQNLFIHIVSPRKVVLFTQADSHGRRQVLMCARVMTDEPDIGSFMDAESMNIELQTRFMQNEDRDILLKIVGNIRDEAVKKYSDDGVSQKVTIETGTATVGDAKVPREVSLIPFRTFSELEQPAANFIFRMRDGGRGALIELTNGSWQLIAMNAIATYFVDNLDDKYFENSHVTILA